MSKKPTGIILYDGPSQIDGNPIVVIANGFNGNNNNKIGHMIQTWIIRSDMHPQDALRGGQDYSVCGDCLHRGEYNPKTKTVANRTCYVNLLRGVFSVYNAYKRGAYVPFNYIEHNSLFEGRHVRIGSYGDPAAVSTDVWSLITSMCKDYTGYTQRWGSCDHNLSEYVMASCTTFDQYKQADMLGWRIFRIVTEDDKTRCSNEIACPAQTRGVQCTKCLLCNGASPNRTHAKNITVDFHGAKGKDKVYAEKLKMLQQA